VRSATVVALAILVTMARPARLCAAEFGLQFGPEPAETIATRCYAALDVTPWLSLQAGALIVHQGAIPDVTPMFHTTGPIFASIGVGFGDNQVDNGRQTKGAIFHDVVGLGYTMTEHAAALFNVQHWSNGWPHNPVFGVSPNGGYTAVTLGLAYRF
jgi:hypothetical protein